MLWHQLTYWARWLLGLACSGLSPDSRAHLKELLKVHAVGWTCFGAVLAGGIFLTGTITFASGWAWVGRLVFRGMGALFITATIGLLWLSSRHDDPRKSEVQIREKVEDMRDLQGDIEDPHTNLRLAESIGTLEWVLEEYDDNHYRESVTPEDDTDENDNETESTE